MTGQIGHQTRSVTSHLLDVAINQIRYLPLKEFVSCDRLRFGRLVRKRYLDTVHTNGATFGSGPSRRRREELLQKAAIRTGGAGSTWNLEAGNASQVWQRLLRASCVRSKRAARR
jgi:hypothetical protein